MAKEYHFNVCPDGPCGRTTKDKKRVNHSGGPLKCAVYAKFEQKNAQMVGDFTENGRDDVLKEHAEQRWLDQHLDKLPAIKNRQGFSHLEVEISRHCPCTEDDPATNSPCCAKRLSEMRHKVGGKVPIYVFVMRGKDVLWRCYIDAKGRLVPPSPGYDR